MHSFEVSLGYESVDRSTFVNNEKLNYIKFWYDLNIIIRIEYRASLKMYFGQRFHTPMKLQKNAFNSLSIIWQLLPSVKWRHIFSYEVKTGPIYGMVTNIKYGNGWF